MYSVRQRFMNKSSCMCTIAAELCNPPKPHTDFVKSTHGSKLESSSMICSNTQRRLCVCHRWIPLCLTTRMQPHDRTEWDHRDLCHRRVMRYVLTNIMHNVISGINKQLRRNTSKSHGIMYDGMQLLQDMHTPIDRSM